MAVALHPKRSHSRSRARGRHRAGMTAGAGPSVREVCLVGGPPGWSAGDVVTWSGRVYRVEAAPGPEGAPYAHLAPEAAPGG